MTPATISIDQHKPIARCIFEMVAPTTSPTPAAEPMIINDNHSVRTALVTGPQHSGKSTVMAALANADGFVISGPEIAEFLLQCVPARHRWFFLTQPELFQEAVLRAGHGIEFALHILGEILSKLGPVLIALDGTAINSTVRLSTRARPEVSRPGGSASA
eukprot:888675-Rhodomonas_salina.1